MQRIFSGRFTLYHCQPHWQRTVSDKWHLRRIALQRAHDLIHITASLLVTRSLVRTSGRVQRIRECYCNWAAKWE